MDVALSNHTHLFVPVDDFTHPSGRRQIQRACVCGLEDRVRFSADGGVEQVRVRYQSGWLDPVDLLTLGLPFLLCADCAGSGQPCEACGGVGVVSAVGERLAIR